MMIAASTIKNANEKHSTLRRSLFMFWFFYALVPSQQAMQLAILSIAMFEAL
jgi:hypothetical protein